jgi:hypothetical protein
MKRVKRTMGIHPRFASHPANEGEESKKMRNYVSPRGDVEHLFMK